jgi:hypothetical protein
MLGALVLVGSFRLMVVRLPARISGEATPPLTAICPFMKLVGHSSKVASQFLVPNRRGFPILHPG